MLVRQEGLWATATVLAVSGLPLLAHCAPAPDRFGATNVQPDLGLVYFRRQLLDNLDGLLDGLSFSEAAVTQTVVSTVLQTMTATTYTTVISSSPSPTDSGAPPTLSSDPSGLASMASGPSQTTSAPSGSALVSPTVSSVFYSASATDQPVSVTPASVSPTPGESFSMSPSALSPASMPSSSSSSLTALSSATLSSASASLSSSTALVSSPSDSPFVTGPTSSPAPAAPSSSPGTAPADPNPGPEGNGGVYSPGPSTGHISRPKPLVMAYYPNWAASALPPEKIDFGRFDWIDFAFAVPTQSFGIGWDGDDDSADLLRRLVSAAHQSGKKVKLSVGGWTGSKYFSPAVSTPQNRQTFVNNILTVYNQFGLDGIDIDWEFPAQAGATGNVVSTNDTANYLAFLQLLRKTLPSAAKISAATMTVPWADPQGNPLKDVSAFASVLDWILIMNYDTWGSSGAPGPNAPLSNACHNSTQSGASAVAGAVSWASAGFPVSKIVMGVPSYGYISRSSAATLITRRSSRSFVTARGPRQRRVEPHHMPMHLDSASEEAEAAAFGIGEEDDPWIETEGAKSSGSKPNAYMVHNEDGGVEDGQVQFRDLVDQKVLQYLSAWSTPTRAVAAASSNEDSTDQDTEDDDNYNQRPGSTNDTNGGVSLPDDPSDDNDSDSQQSDDYPGDDDTSQVGLTSLVFAGQQIVNVFNGLNGFVREWDACSSTPFLHSPAAGQVITYDDPQSLEMKAVFVRAAGMLGVNMFDIHGDTDRWDLTDGLRRGLGL